MSIDTTSARSLEGFSVRDIEFLRLYACGATLEQLAREVLGEQGSYSRVCSVAFRYKNALLSRLGIDYTLPPAVVRTQVHDLLECMKESPDLSSAPGRQFQRLVSYLQDEIGLPDRPSSAPAPEAKGSGEWTKILVLSDLHVPFHNQELLASAVREHGDAHTVVLLGDFLDMYSASRFSRSRAMDPTDEIREAAAILEVLATNFPRVVVLEGNHDTRAQRWLQTNRPEIAPLLLHPFEYIRYVWREGELKRRYQNVEFPQMEVHVSGPLSPLKVRHFTVIGDALFGHFERSLKGPAKTVHSLALEWLPQWEGVLFPQGLVRVVVQAHVHRLSKVQWGRYTLFECGCVADIMGYVLQDPRYSPPQMGYVVLYQKDGVTDVNRSNYYVYSQEVRYGS